MPEELAIILVVLIGVIWLLVKIGQGIGSSIDQATKSCNAASARRKQIRYSRGRDNLRQYVHAQIPDELDGFDKKFERVRIEFERMQKLTEWVARPPAWKKEEFQP